MKSTSLSLLMFILLPFTLHTPFPAQADSGMESRITEVKLFLNQARITRTVSLSLKKGHNRIILGGLPGILYDWSVKGKLPAGYRGKIVSLEVEKKALIKKRQQRILDIEKKLSDLREEDLVLLDRLRNISAQEKFLNSILDFTTVNASKELATRIPQVSIWNGTLDYVTRKNEFLLREKREIEKKREHIGKRIQKWEFELSQIAGYNYFQTYQTMNKAILQNRSQMDVQQFGDITQKYAERDRLLKAPEGKIDIEKRIIIDIDSDDGEPAALSFNYVIPDTSWSMQYDIRASRDRNSIDVAVYSNIRQKTGEDWNDILLSLSTGTPVHNIQTAKPIPVFLDLYHHPVDAATGMVEEKSTLRTLSKTKSIDDFMKKKAPGKTVTIQEKGPFFEITLHHRQTILSSVKEQRKLVKQYDLQSQDLEFYYQMVPSRTQSALILARMKNTTPLPWLGGEAQIFLENEFTGKTSIPFIPSGRQEEIVLGTETRIFGKKEMTKYYEDTSGLFSGKKRMRHYYKITVENQLSKKTRLQILDIIPVSRNEKIAVEIEGLTLPFEKDELFEKTTDFARGIRKWNLVMEPHQKTEIEYQIVLTCDKGISIQALH